MKTITLWSVALSSLILSVTSIQAQEIDERMTVPSSTNVSVENVRGEIRIAGSEGDEVSVKGRLDKDAERLIFEMRGNTLLIKVETPRNSNWNSNDRDGSDLDIRLPKSVNLSVSGVSMDLSVKDLLGGSNVNLVSGDIRAERLHGGVRLNTVSGDIYSRELAGELRLESVSGDIDDAQSDSERVTYHSVSGDIEVQTNAVDVSAQSVSGDIDLKLAKVRALTLKSISGDANAQLALTNSGSIDASTVSGSVDLRFSEEPSARFQLSANAGGNIDNRLSSDRATKAKYGPSRELTFSLGNGTSQVKVDSVSGEISVRDN